ncbi:MAG: peptidylprolyl isomerase [Deltaproteobacteria bacterium]|nr:peptidylprolyl isomerase [Deltaproteobacteria bacterium]
MKQIVVLLLASMFILCCCTQAQEGPKTKEASDTLQTSKAVDDQHVVARVGDAVILDSDLDALLANVPEQYRERYKSPKVQKEVLERLVDVKMLAWEARKRGLDAKPEVKLKIEYLIDQILAKELEADVTENAAVEEDEITAYYNDNTDKFSTPLRIKVRHILVDTQEEAVDVLGRIQKGEDFAELAKTLSKCPSAKKGGDLGWISKGRMDPVFEKAAFEMEKDEISDVVKSSFGFHIIQVQDKKPATVKELSEVKSSIERILKQESMEDALEQLKAKIKQEITISINEEHFTEDVDNQSGNTEEAAPDNGEDSTQ